MELAGGWVSRRVQEAAEVDLFEYQGKQFFAGYGMPVSPGEIAFT